MPDSAAQALIASTATVGWLTLNDHSIKHNTCWKAAQLALMARAAVVILRSGCACFCMFKQLFRGHMHAVYPYIDVSTLLQQQLDHCCMPTAGC